MPHIVLKGQIKDKKKVYAYVDSLCKELGIGRMWSKAIFITFKTVIDDDNQGNCWGDAKEGYVDISIARNSEGIKIPHDQMMQSLAHEMVHAKQYLRGELNGWNQSWKVKNLATIVTRMLLGKKKHTQEKKICMIIAGARTETYRENRR